MSALTEKKQAHAEEGVLCYIPARYVLCVMCFFGLLLVYGIKTSLSEVIVVMVRHPSVNSTESQQKTLLSLATRQDLRAEDLDVCPGSNNKETNDENGEFDWDEELQGYVLSAYYYGYVTTQLLGGRLADVFGAKIIFGPSIMIGGILSLLSPIAARWDVGAFIAVRVLMGVVSGVLIPALHAMIAKWYSLEERTTVGSIMLAGVPVGSVLGLSVSGVVANLLDWSYIYYLFGGLSLLWYVPWLLLVYNTPEDHPRISEQEKTKILTSLGQQENEKVTLPVPWFAILTSLPVWAHVIMSVGYGWIGTTTLTELPNYLTNVLHFDVQESGLLSALPFFFSPFSGPAFGFLSQWLRDKGYVSQLTAYRIFNTICAVGTSACFLVITLVGCESTVIIVLLVLSVVATSALFGGSYLNNLDLCSNFAGTVSGITHTFVLGTGIFTPMVVGYLTSDGESLTQWHTVFYIAISVMMASYLVFMMFASVEEQPWNRPPSEQLGTQRSESSTNRLEEV